MKNIFFNILGLFFLIAAAIPLGAFAQETPREPILIIPGTMASWNWDTMFGKIGTNKWHFLAGVHQYDGLIEALEDEGLVENNDFYIVYYDWRLPNSESAQRYLKPAIDTALENSKADKVDIIAHSMGGLVARAYIQSDGYREDVDDFIMLGTPNHGSSDVYTLWEGGIVPRNWEIEQRIFINGYGWYLNKRVANDKDLYDVVHNQIPSVGELMPTYDFLFDKEASTTKQASEMSEQNTFLAGMNAKPLFDLLSSVGDAINVAGVGTSTVGTIPVVDFNPQEPEEEKLWADGLPEPMPPARNNTEGDNRVLVSSAFFPQQLPPTVSQKNKGTIQHLLGYFISSAYAQFPGPQPLRQMKLETTHGNLPTASISLVLDALGLQKPDKAYEPYIPPQYVMTYWFASPVDVKITDPKGRIITRDNSEIPGAEYDGENDPAGKKMVIIPNAIAGEYTLELTGIGVGGDFDFAVGHFGRKGDSTITINGTIRAGETVDYEISYNPAEPEEEFLEIGAPFDPRDRSPMAMIDELIADIENYTEDGDINPTGIAKSLIADLRSVKNKLEHSMSLKEESDSARFPLWYTARAKFFEHLAVTQLDRFIGRTSIFEEKGFIKPAASTDIMQKTKRIVDAVRKD